MAALGFELLFRILWASMLVLTFVSRHETSERFLKIATWIAVGICSVEGLLLWKALESAKIPTGTPLDQPIGQLHFEFALWALVALLAGILLYARTFRRATRILGFVLMLLSPLPLLWGGGIRNAVNFCSGAFVLGASFAGQYLGHWYLTVPGMHIRELKRATNILLVAIAFKIVEIILSLIAWNPYGELATVDAMGQPISINLTHTKALDMLNFSHSDFGLRGDLWLGFGTFGILLLVSRILWGILAPAILGYMIRKTVDIRATQSATGILYALCVAILFGEGAAIYLRITLRLFL